MMELTRLIVITLQYKHTSNLCSTPEANIYTNYSSIRKLKVKNCLPILSTIGAWWVGFQMPYPSPFPCPTHMLQSTLTPERRQRREREY